MCKYVDAAHDGIWMSLKYKKTSMMYDIPFDALCSILASPRGEDKYLALRNSAPCTLAQMHKLCNVCLDHAWHPRPMLNALFKHVRVTDAACADRAKTLSWLTLLRLLSTFLDSPSNVHVSMHHMLRQLCDIGIRRKRVQAPQWRSWLRQHVEHAARLAYPMMECGKSGRARAVLQTFAPSLLNTRVGVLTLARCVYGLRADSPLVHVVEFMDKHTRVSAASPWTANELALAKEVLVHTSIVRKFGLDVMFRHVCGRRFDLVPETLRQQFFWISVQEGDMCYARGMLAHLTQATLPTELMWCGFVCVAFQSFAKFLRDADDAEVVRFLRLPDNTMLQSICDPDSTSSRNFNLIPANKCLLLEVAAVLAGHTNELCFPQHRAVAFLARAIRCVGRATLVCTLVTLRLTACLRRAVHEFDPSDPNLFGHVCALIR